MGKPSPLAGFSRDAVSELASTMELLRKATSALEQSVAEVTKLRAEKMRVVETAARHVQALKHPSLHPVARQAGEFLLSDILEAMDI